MPLDRREFLQQLGLLSAALAAAGPFAACKRDPEPEAAAAPKPATNAGPLTSAQRAALAAACERILPSDDGPGAREAGVIDFVDRQLGRAELAEVKKRIVGGLLALDRRSARAFGGKKFVELAPSQQDLILHETQVGSAQGEQLLLVLITLTLEGFLSDPAHGGNQGRVGWDYVGQAPCAMSEGPGASALPVAGQGHHHHE